MGASRKSLTRAIEKVAEEIHQQREKEKVTNKINSDKAELKRKPSSK